MIRIRIAVFTKLGIMSVGALHLVSVFDGAPMPLGPGGDFARIGEQAVAIAAIDAIDAVQLLKPVQVGKVTAIK